MKIRPVQLLAIALAGFVTYTLVGRSPGPDILIRLRATEEGAADATETTLPEVMALRPLAKAIRARDVAAGRRSLAEAAALFGALDRLPPEPTKSHQFPAGAAPAAAEEQLLCQQVIIWVEYLLQADRSPDQVRAVIAPLE